MKNELCKKLGIEYPIFAFTHCRDVVVEVSKAGGLGVLGAVGFTPEELKVELDWIDAHIGDKPYGVDVVIPQQYEGIGEMDPEKLEAELQAMIPQGHRDFVEGLLQAHRVPAWPDSDAPRLLGWTQATGAPLVDVALQHPNVVLIANALGTPPQDMIDHIHASGRLVAALCGKVKQALKHKAAGVDIVIAQGSEAGGHTGEITSMVLWPQIAEAIAPTPMLAAGGIGTGKQIAAALAMGAAGAWTGSLWLAVKEAQAEPIEKEIYLKASSEDTVRSRSWTGKSARFLKNEWTEAWEKQDTPDPLGMPLQGLLVYDAMRRTQRFRSVGEANRISFNPAGQVIGMVKEERSCREVMFSLLSDYVDAVERLQKLMPE
ncbi:MAG TPA: nitronate monooxygenase family protein [Pseudomonadales bacterium]